MSTPTAEEAKKLINTWLTENGHQVRAIEDENSSFHFEIDYPLGTLKRQRVIQPNEYPGLIVILNGVAIADEHKEVMKELTIEDKEKFYDDIKKALLFVDNSYDMNLDDKQVAQQVQFSYEFYTDTLTKTQLYKGLLVNHRTLIYIVTVFNEKFGLPEMPEGAGQHPETVQ
ncbi:hypothetical protein MNBD_DELTA01-270 [hydrothermal vent metagenome]|uniref:DUF2299 domain-containing protein n=1 Tax=hydrothermal vent metagenome TaxID=652676 RepID=A0A3B0QST1_9ZZZZ